MVNAENCSSMNNTAHSKHDEEGHVPCPCQTCIDGKTSNDIENDKTEKDNFDLLATSDNVSLHTLDNSNVDILSSTFHNDVSTSSPTSSCSDVSNSTEEDNCRNFVSENEKEISMETFSTDLIGRDETSKDLIQDLRKGEEEEEEVENVRKTSNEQTDSTWQAKQVEKKNILFKKIKSLHNYISFDLLFDLNFCCLLLRFNLFRTLSDGC